RVFILLPKTNYSNGFLDAHIDVHLPRYIVPSMVSGYMIKALEYLTAEILELARNMAQDNKKACGDVTYRLPEDYIENNSVFLSNTVHASTPTYNDTEEFLQCITLNDTQ
ncbi:hypothetical protein EI555_003598, partial [Monodon monoceros]